MQKSKKRIFHILYLIGFLGVGLIGLLSNSFFAYDKFNSLWGTVFYLFFFSLLFITAFVEGVFTSCVNYDLIINFMLFIIGLVVFLLLYIIGGAFTLCAVVFSAAMLIVISCRHALLLRKNGSVSPNINQILGVVVLLLFAMMQQTRVAYVNDMHWLWALIPATVILCISTVIAFILLRKVWMKINYTKIISVLSALGLGLIIFIIAYVYSATAIGVANCIFDGEPTKAEYTVIDKHIQSWSRTATQFEVKVLIDNKEKWVPVQVTDYHEISNGDTIIINYYSGAFNFAYYSYCERCT